MKDSDALEALFAAERRAQPPAGAAERGWAHLAEGLDQGAVPLELSPRLAKVSFATVGKWALVALVASTLGAVVLTSTAGDEHEVPTAVPARRDSLGVGLPTAPSVSSPEETIPAAAISEPMLPAVRRAGPPAPSTKAPAEEAQPSSGSISTFDDELRLIKLAKGHVDSGQGHLAEVTLDEHARSFPNGTFRDERDALRILVLCQGGKRERGAELAEEFARHHAGSPVVERLLRACKRESALPPLSGK